MKRLPLRSSPSTLRNTEMFWASEDSSTTVSGQRCLKKASFSTKCPAVFTSRKRVSKTLGVSGTGFPWHSRRRSLTLSKNSPNRKSGCKDDINFQPPWDAGVSDLRELGNNSLANVSKALNYVTWGTRAV